MKQNSNQVQLVTVTKDKLLEATRLQLNYNIHVHVKSLGTTIIMKINKK